MEPSLNLFALLTLLGAAQAFLFACALVGIKRRNVVANRLLAALLLVVSIILVWNVLLNTRYLLVFPHLAQVHVALQFAIGPLIFLYLKTLLKKETRLGRNALLHFLPSVLCLVYLLPFYLQTRAYKIAYLTAALEHYPTEWYLRTLLVLLQATIYMIPILWMVVRSSRLNREGSGSIDKVDLFWVRIWTGIFLIIWVASVLRFVFDYSVHTNLIIPLFFSFFIYTAVYVKLLRSEATSEIADAAIPQARRYEKSTLTPEKAERFLHRLHQVMAEKPYTDSELTLQKLAERLGISSHHLSQIINERLNQNFFDFVNAHRIEEAKRLLLDPRKKHFSILGVAEEVGFNSKSTFNAAFKKHTAMTPSEWRTSAGGVEHSSTLQEQT
jgi:AraC-like DNA-binding protein